MRTGTALQFLLFALIALAAAPALPARAQQKTNLVADASFEAPAPAWFSETGGNSYYLAKNKSDDAPAGTHVLELRAWREKGARVLSPVFEVPAGVLTATLSLRATGASADSTLALAIFDKKGQKELARFGEISLGDAVQWTVLRGRATTSGGQVRLALLPGGASAGTVVHLDQAGLFAGDSAGEVTDNADWQLIEAETLANGQSWQKRKHAPAWYSGEPSAGYFLTGSPAVKATDNASVTASFQVKNPGAHVLWLRFLYTDAANRKGAFAVALEQNGKTVAERTIESNDENFRSRNRRIRMYWTWVPVRADLAAGTATVRLARPGNTSTWLARNIDLLLLTNLTDYTPDIADLRPQIYMRYTNTGSGEPYCFYGFVHTNGDPSYLRPGMLTMAGFDRSIRVPKDKSKWIAPGRSTPWSNLSPFLRPEGDYNRVMLTATRGMHTSGFVREPIRGTLEFALGTDKKIIRTIAVEQDAPLVRVTVPGDFSSPGAQVQLPWDFVRQEQNALPPLQPQPTAARYLDLTAKLDLSPAGDDPKLFETELQNLLRLGFNGLYYVRPPRDVAQTAAYYRARGMQTRFGLDGKSLWNDYRGDRTQPDRERIERDYRQLAEKYAAILPNVTRLKLADEPGAPSYAALAQSPGAQQKFREYLQANKVSLAELGATAWEQIFPVTEKEKATQPVLFYYSGLFRLHSVAEFARTLVAQKNKYLPNNVKTYVNYSPPFSWAARGADPFLLQRDAGLEMGLSEDWLGYTAGPQHASDTYALLRAAGSGQPLGGYVVGKSGGPLLQRIKYYTMLAGGARTINVYNYGPNYANVDSWSERYDVYPVIRAVQFELGRIDDALHGTTRRKAQIAILYNRTAALWSGSDTAAEQDARFIRWALTHAGYDADIIPEEDIVSGQLEKYKVLYMDGIQLRRDAAAKIAGWVKNGGVLLGGAGAATRDEFNRPQSVLDEVFGAHSVALKTVNAAGRPKFELRTQRVLDTLAASGTPARFDQLCYSETLEPLAGAKVLFRNEAGAVLGTQNNAGRGTAIRLAALPGLAYLNRATRGKDYDPDTYLPQNYDAAQREFLALPARLANVEKVAQSNLEIPEIARYDAPGRSVFFVINYAGTEKPEFSMLVPDASWAGKAYAADGAPVTLQKAENGLTRISFPLNVAGAIVLEK